VHERAHIVEDGLLRIANAEDLGRYVKERRHKRGLTQAQLAANAKVSRRWLSDLEAGKERAEFGLVLRTLRALDVIIDLRPQEETGDFNLDDYLDKLKTRARGARP
jgi:HTH-type transcriptional regulator/antitoxin HipB